MHAPLIVDRLRPLTINPASHPRGQPHLSAASGLVCAHGRAYVIGDDEHHLAIYRDRTSDADLQRLVGGDPPSGKAARKRRKPDFESLLWLSVDGALIALGSGSRPNRDRGVRLLLRHDGTPQPVSQPFDLAPVYEALRARLGAINIEGAFVVGDRLHLLNRGHAAAAGNVAVCYRLRDFIDLIDGSNSAVEPLSMQAFELGTIGGVAWALPTVPHCPAAAGSSAPWRKTTPAATPTVLAAAPRSALSRPMVVCSRCAGSPCRTRSKASTRNDRPTPSCCSWSPMPMTRSRPHGCSARGSDARWLSHAQPSYLNDSETRAR